MLVLFFHDGDIKALKNTTDEEKLKALAFIVDNVDKIDTINGHNLIDIVNNILKGF